MKTISLNVAGLLTAALFSFGCASTDVNPKAAKANTGYVDLYAPEVEGLAYDVRSEEASNETKKIYSEVNPVPGEVLRLSFAPGHHTLRVTLNNRLVAKTERVEIDVQEGKVTPIKVALKNVGTTQVETTEASAGRYGRRTKFGSDTSVVYTLALEAGSPLPYQVKERMAYATK